MRDIRLSVLVIAELRRGCLILPEGRRRRELEAATASLLEGLRARVLPVDLETALIWSRVSASCRRAGRTIQVVDGLIAATALRHDAALVTRNVRDFEATGVRLINPWSDAP
jgi:predicted nucleic acid-binding protein